MFRNLKTYFLAVALPLFVIWAALYAFTEVYHQHIFKGFGLNSEFYIQFRQGSVGQDYPAIDMLVLGDSTGRASINPLDFKNVFAVNLSLNGGSAVTGYVSLIDFLASQPAPRCVVYVSQYLWQRNYGNFFSKFIYHGVFTLADMPAMWRAGQMGGAFPVSDYNLFTFYMWGVLATLRINEIPLTAMQAAISKIAAGRPAEPDLSVTYRGFMNGDSRRIKPDTKFFREEMHGAFTRPFEPSTSEDFYVEQMIKVARDHGLKFIYLQPPVAEIQTLGATKEFREARFAHLDGLIKKYPDALYLQFAESLPRHNFVDFTHMRTSGARYVAEQLEPYINRFCVATPAQ